MTVDYRDRELAVGFGAAAAAYDETRPSYPTDLVRWLSRHGVGTAVDVGCGTGQVSQLLQAAGWAVIGVEPDPRMADLARAHGVHVTTTDFETWEPPHGGFDLVCSGTAWHWLDASVAYDQAAAVLRSGGRLAVFRNRYIYDVAVMRGIRAALRRFAPHLVHDCVPLGAAPAQLVEGHAAEIAARPDLFVDLDRQTFSHMRTVTASEWVDELTTHTPIARLEPPARHGLLGELGVLARSSDTGTIRIRHETPCLVATRR
jgi:SAM-dependent methyltransferase